MDKPNCYSAEFSQALVHHEARPYSKLVFTRFLSDVLLLVVDVVMLVLQTFVLLSRLLLGAILDKIQAILDPLQCS